MAQSSGTSRCNSRAATTGAYFCAATGILGRLRLLRTGGFDEFEALFPDVDLQRKRFYHIQTVSLLRKRQCYSRHHRSSHQ